MNPLRARPMETGKHMMTLHNYVCPHCDHLLVPVREVEGARRKVIAVLRPAPYCDDVECLPRGLPAEFAAREGTRLLPRANGEPGAGSSPAVLLRPSPDQVRARYQSSVF